MPGAFSEQTLRNIQGNIIAPFNKPRQFFMFLNFQNSQRNARAWIRELSERKVIATTEEVARHLKERKDTPEGQDAPTHEWVGVSLTSSALVTLRPELAADLVPYDAFWRGAPADRLFNGRRTTSPTLLGGAQISDPEHWVVGGPNQLPVDVLLTIAGDNETLVEAKINDELSRAERHDLHVILVDQGDGTPTSGQCGERLEAGIEHFGFRDGTTQVGIRHFTEERLQPGLRREAVSESGAPIIAAGEFVLGYERERGSYPGAAWSVPPPWMRDGSFQVFLRLTQDVHGWRTQMDRLRASSHAGLNIEAKAIGRTKKGTPLATLGRGGEVNDFTYDDDAQGLTTPLFSHIRLMNDRAKESLDKRTHHLARRAIPFGPPLPDGEPDDGKQRGLLFNAFMASIESQFEYLARTAAGDNTSLATTPRAFGGPDPVIGASDAPCLLRQEGREAVEIHFGRFVRTSGAVYAFAPSLTTLSWLADVQQTQVK